MPVLELTYPRPDIAVVTLNRPDKLNALSYELVETKSARFCRGSSERDPRST